MKIVGKCAFQDHRKNILNKASLCLFFYSAFTFTKFDGMWITM